MLAVHHSFSKANAASRHAKVIRIALWEVGDRSPTQSNSFQFARWGYKTTTFVAIRFLGLSISCGRGSLTFRHLVLCISNNSETFSATWQAWRVEMPKGCLLE